MPTMESASPSAHAISVADGRKETIFATDKHGFYTRICPVAMVRRRPSYLSSSRAQLHAGVWSAEVAFRLSALRRRVSVAPELVGRPSSLAAALSLVPTSVQWYRPATRFHLHSFQPRRRIRRAQPQAHVG